MDGRTDRRIGEERTLCVCIISMLIYKGLGRAQRGIRKDEGGRMKDEIGSESCATLDFFMC